METNLHKVVFHRQHCQPLAFFHLRNQKWRKSTLKNEPILPDSFSDRIASLYPKLKIDLDNDTEPQITAIVRKETLSQFDKLLGAERGAISNHNVALLRAVNAYLDGVLDRSFQRPLKDDNAALAKVANRSAQLEAALLDLVDHPHLETQLVERIRGFHALAEGPNGTTLPDMIGERRNVFRFLRDLLIDLQTCAEQTTNHKPKLSDYDTDFFVGDQPTAERQYNHDLIVWRRRSAERNLGADYPLQCFLLAIYPYWVSHSSHPFTEGMYYSELGRTASPVIDALFPILSKIDGAITPQRVATTLRKLREEGKFLELS